ncbi:MAG: HNH endonuclease [Actinobacteria bacterium]|nr:HNH endonuclease [Actinomycetota bacterium]
MAFPDSVKAAAKKRSGGRCECMRSSHEHAGRCTKKAREYNHIESKKAGGADTLLNCEHLCKACHLGTRSYGAH